MNIKTQSIIIETANGTHESGYQYLKATYQPDACDCCGHTPKPVERLGDAIAIIGEVGIEVRDGKLSLFARGRGNSLSVDPYGSCIEISSRRTDAR